MPGGGGVEGETKQFGSRLSWMAVDSSSPLSTVAEKSSKHYALFPAVECSPLRQLPPRKLARSMASFFCVAASILFYASIMPTPSLCYWAGLQS